MDIGEHVYNENSISLIGAFSSNMQKPDNIVVCH